MKSLILTVLYLARDTIHRWLTRISSPVARVLVVFFLSLCALCFLGTYVISAKVIRDRIRQQGGDLVRLDISCDGSKPCALPAGPEVERLLGAESLGMCSIARGSLPNGQGVNVVTYDFARMGQWMPWLARSGMPTLLIGENSSLLPGPSRVQVQGREVDVFVRRVGGEGLCARYLRRENLLLLQPDSDLVAALARQSPYSMQILQLRLPEGSGSAGVERAVAFCENYMKLEGAHGNIYSALPLLREMDIILSNQMQCRLAFCLGVSAIVGILLTALASMEYRQNEYIYTLMKSFGISPLLLVGSFIVENLLLVGASFLAAVGSFMYFQEYLVRQFFKVGRYSLKLTEIMPELQLVAVSLLGCVLVSSVPIIFAANRDIGRVLK